MEARQGQRRTLFPARIPLPDLRDGKLEDHGKLDQKDSWVLAAAQKDLPIMVPGWEDSTLGNTFASYVCRSNARLSTVRTGIEYMVELAKWYEKTSQGTFHWLFPDRRRHSRGFPHLRGAHDRTEP